MVVVREVWRYNDNIVRVDGGITHGVEGIDYVAVVIPRIRIGTRDDDDETFDGSILYSLASGVEGDEVQEAEIAQRIRGADMLTSRVSDFEISDIGQCIHCLDTVCERRSGVHGRDYLLALRISTAPEGGERKNGRSNTHGALLGFNNTTTVLTFFLTVHGNRISEESRTRATSYTSRRPSRFG